MRNSLLEVLIDLFLSLFSPVVYIEKTSIPEELSLEAKVEPEPVFIDEVLSPQHTHI